MIVALCGYGRVGKDTAAKWLIDHHAFTRIALADAVKEAAVALDPYVEVDTHTYEGKTTGIYTRLAPYVKEVGMEHAKSLPDVRRLLQRMGTEAGRGIHGDDCWIRVLLQRAEAHDRVVVTDVRFPNEAAAIRSAGGKVYRIHRPGVGPLNDHPSETSVDLCEVDGHLHNDSTPEALGRLLAWEVLGS